MPNQQDRPIAHNRTCVVLGEQSLLTRCCDQLLENHYLIQLVVTQNPLIMEWCAAHSIQHVANYDVLLENGTTSQIDYLFSITNLKVLPPQLLALASQYAINFHDGPLPNYGGLNAPVWSLLNDEIEHGVTWHVMTSDVDSGELLVQKRFPIDSNETAFSLNAKCYEAAIDSFSQLLEHLQHTDVTKTTHELAQDSYHGLADRPEAAATLSWLQPASKINRLVRSLDFDRFYNPVVSPRLNLGSLHLLVKASEVQIAEPIAAPGTILGMSADTLNVATIDGSIQLTNLSDLAGKSISVSDALSQSDFKLGDRLPDLDGHQRDAISCLVKDLCRHESYWNATLLRSEPLATPYALPGKKHESNWQQKEFSLCAKNQNGEFIAAVFALLLARLSTKADFTLALRTLALQQYEPRLQAYVSQVVPLAFNYDPEMDFNAWRILCSNRVQEAEHRIGFLTDIFARDPDLEEVIDSKHYPIRLERVHSLSDAIPFVDNGNTQLVLLISENASAVKIHYDAACINEESVTRLCDQFTVLLSAVIENPSDALQKYPLLPDAELQLLQTWNSSRSAYDPNVAVHQLVERQAAQVADGVAYQFGQQKLTYGQLNSRANQLARFLQDNGAQAGDLIGVFLDRTLDMVVALLATLKAGCAYVPMDPAYPEGRLNHMVADSQLAMIITQQDYTERQPCSGIQLVLIEEMQAEIDACDDSDLNVVLNTSSLAYVIYTSGSTGTPKGVMVEHRNVTNFFAGMDQRIEPGPGTWLAVTSISFDISVLEIFWTLCRGFTVVLHSDANHQPKTLDVSAKTSGESVEFGLFYWNVATKENEYDTDKYKLLLESAKYADANGFSSIWTPERHFDAFGGLFPNPSVTSAALATITERIAIRAGSCVVPLHNPIRIAEEWAVVDNLSNGRVGIAMAAGWAAPDFAIKPENFSDAKNIMFESAKTVQRLWRGETVEFPGPKDTPVKVRTLPRPLQAELPLWITTAGNIDNFKSAGEMGANLLTHLLGQTIEEVAKKIKAYRQSWKHAGHAGEGVVTVMLHTFVGKDQAEVEDVVRQPLKNYLKSAMFLVKESAWQFPTFKKMSEQQGKTLDEFFETISEEDMDALLEFAFERYFRTSGLFGTPESCMPMIDKINSADVDEVACLIDFGIKDDVVLEHLPYLNDLYQLSRDSAAQAINVSESLSLPELMQKNDVTHLQCTPSMATLLAADREAHAGLAKLQHMMVGGEAFPLELSKSLDSLVGGRVTNMYGPTETTIWSTTGDVRITDEQFVSIGHVLPNQQCYILDKNQQRLPIGMVGELYIAGDGVVRGYLNRPDLTADAFFNDPYSKFADAKMYRTGDLARYLPDGRLECLGRVDQQVKIRGYRVELGEIESVMCQNRGIKEAVVVLTELAPGDKRLVAYLTCIPGSAFDKSDLKNRLREQLPEFMVPTIFVVMDKLPLTPNGKIDRNKLPEPSSAQRSKLPVNEPDSSTQKLLVEIWIKVLSVESVGVKDNFFDIGGHSLLIVQVLNELSERVSKPVKLTDLFKYTTIEALATFLDSDGEAANMSDNKANNMSQGQARVAARKASMARRRRRSAP